MKQLLLQVKYFVLVMYGYKSQLGMQLSKDLKTKSGLFIGKEDPESKDTETVTVTDERSGSPTGTHAIHSSLPFHNTVLNYYIS